jgi:hypothetical protein
MNALVAGTPEFRNRIRGRAVLAALHRPRAPHRRTLSLPERIANHAIAIEAAPPRAVDRDQYLDVA